MNKLKHIFITLFFVSVTALTFQSVVTTLLKDGNVLKKQLYSNNIPVSEEEDETEKTKMEEDDLFSEHNTFFFENHPLINTIWPEDNHQLYSCSIPIYTPPPENKI